MKEVHRKQPSGIGIKGIGSYVPEDTLTNSDLEQMVDTSDQWITERTGIRKRHRASPDTTDDTKIGEQRMKKRYLMV